MQSEQQAMSEPNFVEQIWAQVMAVPIAGVVLMGALGGATNALVVKVKPKQAIRLTILGAMCAAGSGSLSGALLEHWGFLPSGMALASSGAVAFFAGLFFPALFEVILSRLQAGKLPTDNGGTP